MHVSVTIASNIYFFFYHTGGPTKDETSETTVRTLYCLFPYVNGFPQLQSSKVFLIIKYTIK